MSGEELPEGWASSPLLEVCELIRGVCKLDDRLLLILDVDRVVQSNAVADEPASHGP